MNDVAGWPQAVKQLAFDSEGLPGRSGRSKLETIARPDEPLQAKPQIGIVPAHALHPERAGGIDMAQRICATPMAQHRVLNAVERQIKWTEQRGLHSPTS